MSYISNDRKKTVDSHDALSKYAQQMIDKNITDMDVLSCNDNFTAFLICIQEADGHFTLYEKAVQRAIMAFDKFRKEEVTQNGRNNETGTHGTNF